MIRKYILSSFSLICILLEIFLVDSQGNFIDNGIIISSITGQALLVTGLIFNLYRLNEIVHVLYAVLLITTPVLSFNNDILILHVVVILWTLSIRKIYNRCIWRDFENKKKYIQLKMINWDLLFPILANLSLVKIFLISHELHIS